MEKKLKDYEKLLIGVVNDYVDDYSIQELFEILFPGATVGEIVNDMFNSGLIPDDVMEEFLND